MSVLCLECGVERLDGRRRCPCGAAAWLRLRLRLPALRLRCEWCKQLFNWEPVTVAAIRGGLGIPATCGDACKGRLASHKRALTVTRSLLL